MAEQGFEPKRGVSLYSYQQEYYLGQMSVEDCVARSAEMGAYGIEIISEQMLPGYPNYSDAYYEEWHRMLAKYNAVPTCHDMFYDFKRFKGKLWTVEEGVASLQEELRHAKRLGCFCVRAIVLTPADVIEKCIPLAEELGIRILLEIHSPFHFDHEHIQRHVEVYERSGSGMVGFVPDMGIFVKKFPRVVSNRVIRDGGRAEVVERIVSAYDNGEATSDLPAQVEQEGGNAQEIGLARTAGHFVNSDPRRLLDFMKFIHHIHGKFYDMTADYVETSIAYDEVLAVLAEGGYRGYISAEYEGQRHIQDLNQVDSVEQVRRYQQMLASKIAKLA